MAVPEVIEISPSLLVEARDRLTKDRQRWEWLGFPRGWQGEEAEVATTAMLLQMEDLSSFRYDVQSPAAVFLLVSGGDDSVALAARCYPWLTRCWQCEQSQPVDIKVVHIDTGIGLPETRQYVQDLAMMQGWELVIRKTPVSYEELVRKHGFPGPSSHRYMYIQLKERPLQTLIREYRPQMSAWKRWFAEQIQQAVHFPLWYQRGMFHVLALLVAYLEHEQQRPVILLTGVRQQESLRRMGHVRPFQRVGRQLWVAPLLQWSKEEVLHLLEAERIPRNPASVTIHKSGECLCGAYARRGELQELCFWFPDTGKRLLELERIAREEGFPWGWEEGPPEWWEQAKAGQAFLPGFEPEPGWLCSSCVAERASQSL